MGRLDRFNIPGATYHVMNRGNHKDSIYRDPADRRRFLRIWQEQQEVYGVETLGGCQMGNHFHDIVTTPNGNLSEFMQQVEGQFARFSNWRHRRVGHLFQGRFRSVRIEHDVQLLTALCYVFMNPVAGSLCLTPQGYQWSTYAATVGLAPVPSYLNLDWLTALFPGHTFKEAQQRLIRIITGPMPIATYLQDDELGVHPQAIRQAIQSYTGSQIQYGLLPRMYRAALRPSLAELLRTSSDSNDRFIYDARIIYGYTNSEIARAMRLHSSTVSKIFRKHQRLVDVA